MRTNQHDKKTLDMLDTNAGITAHKRYATRINSGTMQSWTWSAAEVHGRKPFVLAAMLQTRSSGGHLSSRRRPGLDDKKGHIWISQNREKQAKIGQKNMQSVAKPCFRNIPLIAWETPEMQQTAPRITCMNRQCPAENACTSEEIVNRFGFPITVTGLA